MNRKKYLHALAAFGVGSAHPGGIRSTKEMFRKESIAKKDKILDVGCGTGVTSAYLAETFGCEVHAIDLHPIMLEKAKMRMQKQNLDVNVKKASIEKLPYEASMFNYVVSESVLSFVDLDAALAEIYFVLTTNGVLIINELCVLQSLSEKEREEIQSFYHFSKLNNEDEWRNHLKKAGFTQVERIDSDPTGNETAESEFQPSEQLSLELFDLLDEHERLVNQFQNKLGHILLRCKK